MTLGALTMAWISAEAALPLEWNLSGVFRFDGDLWVAQSEGPAFDDYTAGVAEMPARWPTAALRAQAVAARTYAWHQMELGTFAARGY
ncbi:MAG: SpoIID/LytB domain-containing protein, partial [Chloroflexota bacterium]